LHLFVGKSTKKLLLPELLFLAQICTKSFVGWGFAQDPIGELTALLRPLAVFIRSTSKGWGVGREGREEERGGERRRQSFSFSVIILVRTCGRNWLLVSF